MALELVQPAARDERADDRVERVLGRGADQRHEARLDDRQQRVLLRLVEAVDLVDEEDGAPALRAEPLAGAADHGLHVGLARRDRGELLEADCVLAATMRASVVLPVPGGPKKIDDETRSSSIARRSAAPSPTSCGWPVNSSSARGRRRSASGACAARRSSAASSNRLTAGL